MGGLCKRSIAQRNWRDLARRRPPPNSARQRAACPPYEVHTRFQDRRLVVSTPFSSTRRGECHPDSPLSPALAAASATQIGFQIV